MHKKIFFSYLLVTVTLNLFSAESPIDKPNKAYAIATYQTPDRNLCNQIFQSIEQDGYAPALNMQIIGDGQESILRLDLADESHIAWNIKTKQYLGNAKRSKNKWEPTNIVKSQEHSCCGAIIVHDSPAQILGQPIEHHTVQVLVPILLMMQK